MPVCNAEFTQLEKFVKNEEMFNELGEDMSFKTFIAGAVLAVFATGASAATCSTGTGGNSATFTLLPDSAISAAQCIGTFSNEDGANGFFSTPGVLFTGTSFETGTSEYTKAWKGEDGSGDKSIVFATNGEPALGAKSGNWAIDTLNGYTHVVLILKAGTNFGAFLLDGDPLSGTWSSSKGLSHASLWRTDDQGGGGNNNGVVPLPAAGWMLLAGVGGLAAMRRKRKV